MLVPELLIETLEDLIDDDFKKLKWYLTLQILDSCNPIRRSHLDTASRTETVSKMIESYGEESAVNITAEILKKIGYNNTAERLKKMHAGGKTPSTSSSAVAPPAAPATMMAQQGSVIIAPTVTGGTSGTWNITINK
ncbi:pyrin-like [Chaetodon auriga]|uniref:pyrin-like n=1 Tax=Chaetodon auriga TaxID=39042 RepID=UPI004032F628